MISIGSDCLLKVTGETPSGFLLSDGEQTVLLPRKLSPPALCLGNELTVFVYTDSEDRPVATTQKPHAKVGDFALMRVVDETVHGAFLDWGLDKDLFVPKAEQHHRMVQGRSYVVAVFLDNLSGRVAAASRLGQFFDYDVSQVTEGQSVTLLVHGLTDQGAHVIVDDRYSGLVFRSEMFSPLAVGQKLSGFVAKVRGDNKLDIRLSRTGASGQKDARTIVLAALTSKGGLLPLGDKSPPEQIYQQLGLSKKAFKAAIGVLYKERLVELAPQETRLSKAT